ncbi:ShlB/FhaC/HecB family hemolysin secretion/activation protein [Sphingomonas sabuli]|uniref:ShlB/FhaC/HecB family hemolysin secretion/activation protein n=1 Tax=Sphingomonas sabuli TaxID=2764186 RepID=A0A7G9L413_9SPHN|nr:ShlB/FhaC/HecB family hemolysin secretion/activation protein [Sphingomonas sabuli]QNM83362.1 ShlB/FhaC/HecB family hemolysin secretion/activation protein [Sphingomonas sabuli]
MALQGRRKTSARAAMLRSATLALAVPAASVAAQAPPPVPPQAAPPTREEVTRPDADLRRDRAIRLEVDAELERSPCALDTPEFKHVRLTLRGVEFDGLQGLSGAAMADRYVGLTGTEQPISIVCEIRDRAAAKLRAAGYIAAVQVPEQKITDGTVRFQVVMARLAQVRVRGNANGAERIIAAYLNKLSKRPVFNRFEAERYLLLASDLPGYTVRLTLRPAGTKPGEVLGDVTVQRTPIYSDINIQNGGSKILGRWGGFARAQAFGITGLADRTTIGVFSTADFSEQTTMQVGHDFALGDRGMRAGGMFTYARARPSIEGPDDLTARTLLSTLQVDYPIVRKLDRTIRGSVGIDIADQDVDFVGERIARDRLRTAFLRLGIEARGTDFSADRNPSEPPWRVYAQADLRKGVDMLGATEPCPAAGCTSGTPQSRLNGLSTATVVRTLLQGEYRPLPKLTFAIAAQAQYSWKPLLSFDQFAAGNYSVGRGYDPGSLLGDRGFGARSEIRYGSTVPADAKDAAIEGYVFYDWVTVDSVGPPLIAGRDHLASAGIGARGTYDRFVLDAVLAVPLTRIGFDEKRPDPRLLISVTTRLWPWTYE